MAGFFAGEGGVFAGQAAFDVAVADAGHNGDAAVADDVVD